MWQGVFAFFKSTHSMQSTLQANKHVYIHNLEVDQNLHNNARTTKKTMHWCSLINTDSHPPLWARRQHACLSCSGPRFDPQLGQVSWVRFFQGFSSPVRQMSGSFRPPRSPNIIWPSFSSSLIIHYRHEWTEMLMPPKTLKIWYRFTVVKYGRKYRFTIATMGIQLVLVYI